MIFRFFCFTGLFVDDALDFRVRLRLRQFFLVSFPAADRFQAHQVDDSFFSLRPAKLVENIIARESDQRQSRIFFHMGREFFFPCFQRVRGRNHANVALGRRGAGQGLDGFSDPRLIRQ